MDRFGCPIATARRSCLIPDGGTGPDVGAIDVGLSDAMTPECEPIAPEFAGRWVFSSGLILTSTPALGVPLGACGGIGGSQSLAALELQEDGTFKGPLAEDPSNDFEGCAVPVPGTITLRLDVKRCSRDCAIYLSSPGLLGTVSFAPTGALRLQVDFTGEAFVAEDLDNCLGCGPLTPQSMACRSLPSVPIQLRYDPAP